MIRLHVDVAPQRGCGAKTANAPVYILFNLVNLLHFQHHSLNKSVFNAFVFTVPSGLCLEHLSSLQDLYAFLSQQ